ncbi:hypothetical protein HYH03_016829 [Edaphochlamys debaryana]|uniref:Protein kinase domain-containing protein n=1 Tax=Edaphochlamys debaryana TaxID=47281 RepID=A0A835XP01_9CHLO|nr:hypothetical protein HYH03_016829 [Edaphochlamys debaryana]|eukprot:KAG2484415.1 hypothetical protein HYH03_016829 [Edaphochlamys debaryana]
MGQGASCASPTCASGVSYAKCSSIWSPVGSINDHDVDGTCPLELRASPGAKDLHKALKEDDAAAVRAELDRLAASTGQAHRDLLRTSDVGFELLCASAWSSRKNDACILREFLRLAGPSRARAVDKDGRSLLHWAVHAKNLAAIKLLLKDPPRLDPSAPDLDGVTPLHYAASTGCQGIACILLKAGADIFAADVHGSTPVHLACANGDERMVSMLLGTKVLSSVAAQGDSGCSSSGPADEPSRLDSSGWAPEHYAACANCPNALKALREVRPQHFDVPAGEQAGPLAGWTPLMCSVLAGATEAMSVLLTELNANMGCAVTGAYGMAKCQDTWRESWPLRSYIPLLRTTPGEVDSAFCFARVNQAFTEALWRSRRCGSGPRKWRFALEWKDLEPCELGPAPKGGFGHVSKYTYRGTPVAVKRLFRADDEALQHEFDMMRAYPPHEHIVQLMGITIDPSGQRCLVMNWYPEDLHQLFKKAEGSRQGEHKLTSATRFRIALELAMGLQFLHSMEEPIVHRDVKPDNIMLTEELHVRITDFGISKVQAAEGGVLSQQGNGSALWMAPELMAGHKPMYTEAVDVYGWGMIFCQLVSCKDHKIYELLDKDLIHLGEGERLWCEQVAHLQMHGPQDQRERMPQCILAKLPRHLSHLPPALHKDVLDLASACLSVKPGTRPAMRQVVERTRSLLERYKELTAKAPPSKRGSFRLPISLSLRPLAAALSHKSSAAAPATPPQGSPPRPMIHPPPPPPQAPPPPPRLSPSPFAMAYDIASAVASIVSTPRGPHGGVTYGAVRPAGGAERPSRLR